MKTKRDLKRIKRKKTADFFRAKANRKISRLKLIEQIAKRKTP